ncbi:MAG: hypothetical protein QNJ41_16090 [Xenococcaceae cyanobacterium MO_188.B32]|nr:hypothetical protein [Xenococcaceae cyanobacterium MO_188.B32]
MGHISLSGLSKGLVIPFIPFLLQVDTYSQIALDSHVHDADCDRSHPVTVHRKESSDEEFHLAGYGSCAYCSCPAFTESYYDSYRCACGHGWDDHFSSGA